MFQQQECFQSLKMLRKHKIITLVKQYAQKAHLLLLFSRLKKEWLIAAVEKCSIAVVYRISD